MLALEIDQAKSYVEINIKIITKKIHRNLIGTTYPRDRVYWFTGWLIKLMDPDPYWDFWPDQDPHQINTDSKHWSLSS